MKVALISYHKNLYSHYPGDWICQYRESIEKQTFQDFTIYEVNYGDGIGMAFFRSQFQSRKFDTFVHCMNWMLNWLFHELKFDYVFNSNVDDFYDVNWIEKTLQRIQRGYDLVSSNFHLFNDSGIYHTHKFHNLDIQKELSRNHNIICHPGVCYSRKFWIENGPYIPEEIPYEDLKMWQRALMLGAKILIQRENFVFHRVHEKSVCQSNNR